MFPLILNHPPFVIPAFFFMVMIGVLTATFYLYFRAPKLGFSQIAVLDMGIVGAIFGILGARIFHVLFEYPQYYLEHPMRFFEFWRGGFVSFGAYILGATAVIVYLKIRKLPIAKYGDFVALCLPIIVFFVRLGCLGAGCCYGKPTDWHFHLVFTNTGSDAGSKFAGIPLYPTQILDQMNAVFIFVVLHLRYKHKKFDGEIALLFFALYAIIRSAIELLRGDMDRGVYFNGHVSTGQITSAVFVLICATVYVILWKRNRK